MSEPAETRKCYSFLFDGATKSWICSVHGDVGDH